jgi:cytochrome c peroxidase
MNRALSASAVFTLIALVALCVSPIGCAPPQSIDGGDGEPQSGAEGDDQSDGDPAGDDSTDQQDADQQASTAVPAPPLGLPAVPIPDDNPMTAAKIELGKLLYFDKRVSKDGTISCATCHDPQVAWAEDRKTSAGIADAEGNPRIGGRNSPSVINTAYAKELFWDGRAASLEEQAVGPVGNPIEMGSSMEDVVHGFSKIPGYERRFQEVFGTGVTEEGFAKAVAAFERTILSGNSPYDKFQAGDKTALSEQEQNGMLIFSESCAVCHAPPVFSNWQYHNAGIGTDAEEPDVGRMEVTGNERDKGKFRVPALREVAKTAPYFHDGSAETLEEAVAVMGSGGVKNDNLSRWFVGLQNQPLTADEQADVVAFLKSLSGEFPVVEPPTEFPR